MDVVPNSEIAADKPKKVIIYENFPKRSVPSVFAARIKIKKLAPMENRRPDAWKTRLIKYLLFFVLLFKTYI